MVKGIYKGRVGKILTTIPGGGKKHTLCVVTEADGNKIFPYTGELEFINDSAVGDSDFEDSDWGEEY